MALGNRGLGLSEYGRALHDSGHRERFYLFAHRDLSAALSDLADYAGYEDAHAKAAFAERRSRLETIIEVEEAVRRDDDAMGSTDDERRYRQWAVAEGLFLNPLNDLGVHAIATRDVFGLPSFTTDIDEPPTLVGLFNQMKQEYVSARWMLYEGTTAEGPHFSDRDVTLHNTLDYPTYSVAIEKVKAAFRIAYSLLLGMLMCRLRQTSFYQPRAMGCMSILWSRGISTDLGLKSAHHRRAREKVPNYLAAQTLAACCPARLSKVTTSKPKGWPGVWAQGLWPW
jgi:hypothetical protein